MDMNTHACKEKKSIELKKHVAVIHSNSNISLLQRKISNALLFNAYDTLLTKDEHEIHLTELTKLIGYDSHDHKKIKHALMDLLATVIEWNIVDGEKIDKEKTWNASSIIADASIRGSLCTYSYSNKMRQLLYHPSVYGRLNMHVQAKFQSSYGLALYENCNRYQDIGQTPWFELQKFRKLMGVSEDKYPIFRDFKVRVLNKSVEEVNKYSSLVVEPKLRKLNRQVVAIQFIIKAGQSLGPEVSKQLASVENLSDLLKQSFGLSKKQIMSVLETYEPAYIRDKILVVESSSSYRAGKIKNLAKYFLCALSEDYQAPQSVSKPMPIAETKVKEHENVFYEQYRRQVIVEAFTTRADIAITKCFDQFRIYIGKTVFSKYFEQDGLTNILVQDQLVKFALSMENQPIELLPYDEWRENTAVNQ